MSLPLVHHVWPWIWTIKGGQLVSAACLRINLVVVGPNVFNRMRTHDWVPEGTCASGVPEKNVVDQIEALRVRACEGPFPHDLVLEILIPEDLVHQHLHVVDRVPVEVDVDAAGRGEQLLEQLQPPAQHGEEAVEPLAPGVLVGQHLDQRGLFLDLHLLVAAEIDVDGVVGAEVVVHHEGRVDVDEVDLAPVAPVARASDPSRRAGSGARPGCHWSR